MTVAPNTESSDIHYTVIDRDSGERYSTTSSTSRDRTERERNRLALGWSGKNVALGIGRINLDGTIDDVTDDVATLVVVETMPDHLRGSHRAARNWGVYPHNGAERIAVSREEAEEIVANDPDGYARIVESERSEAR